MVNFGNGFTWKEVYHMPIHWRRFYFQKLVESKKKESEQINKSQQGNIPKGPSVKVRK